jgi:hypothetical protein
VKILTPKSSGPQAAQSILSQLYADLDFAYAKCKRRSSHHRHIKRGIAVGIAHAVAVMTNPYAPDFMAVWIEAEKRYAHARAKAQRSKRRAS